MFVLYHAIISAWIVIRNKEKKWEIVKLYDVLQWTHYYMLRYRALQVNATGVFIIRDMGTFCVWRHSCLVSKIMTPRSTRYTNRNQWKYKPFHSIVLFLKLNRCNLIFAWFAFDKTMLFIRHSYVYCGLPESK